MRHLIVLASIGALIVFGNTASGAARPNASTTVSESPCKERCFRAWEQCSVSADYLGKAKCTDEMHSCMQTCN
jgi:hypothetical protein